MNTRFYNARILTMDGGYDIIEGELWVQGDKIIYIGDGKDVNEIYKAQPNNMILWDREIDVKRNLLMPGFKNAHTHTAMTFLRTYADDLPLQEWLTTKIFPKEGLLRPEDVYYCTKLGVMEYLTSGITACFDMYMKIDAFVQAACECGFRTVQVDSINNFGGTVADVERNFNKYNNYDDLTSYVLGFHAEYTTSRELMTGIAELARKYKAPVFMHSQETKAEVEGCKERYGVTPTQLFDELGMYEYGGGGYHCVWMEDRDLEIYKEKGLYAVTNPGSNTKLASGIAPIQKMLDMDINLAIGTDGASSNNCLDMFREMFLMTGLGKLREMDAAAVPAEKVLYAATVGGAGAMGLKDCDVLAPGKKADIIMIDLYQPNMQPENNLVKNLVYSGSKQNVKMTMVNGAILYEDNKFNIGVDPMDIYAHANEVIRRMKKEHGEI